jgi:hypothetical protein
MVKYMPTIPRKEYLLEALLVAVGLSMIKVGLGGPISPILDMLLLFVSILILSLIIFLPKPVPSA